MYRASRRGHITENPAPSGFVEVYDLSYNDKDAEVVAPDLIIVDVPRYSAEKTPQSGPQAGNALTQAQANWERYIPGKSPTAYTRSQYTRGFRRFVDRLENLHNEPSQEYLQIPLTEAAASKMPGLTLAESELDEFASGDMAKYLIGLVVNEYPYELVSRDQVIRALDKLNELLVNARQRYRVAVPPIGCTGGGLTYGGDYGVYDLIKERLQPAVDKGHVIYILKPKPESQIQEPTQRGSRDPGIDSPTLYSEVLYLDNPQRFIAITNSENADAYALNKIEQDHHFYARSVKEYADSLVEGHDEKRADLVRKLSVAGVSYDTYIKHNGSSRNPISPGMTEAERVALLMPAEDERNILRFAADTKKYASDRKDLIKAYRKEYLNMLRKSGQNSQDAEPDYLECMDIMEEYEQFGQNSSVSEEEYKKAKEFVERSYVTMDKKRRKRALESGRPIIEKVVQACLREIRLENEYENKLEELKNAKTLQLAYSAIDALGDVSNSRVLIALNEDFLPVVKSSTDSERVEQLARFSKKVKEALLKIIKSGNLPAAAAAAAAAGVGLSQGVLSSADAGSAATAAAKIITDACDNEEARISILRTRALSVARSKQSEEDRNEQEAAAKATFARGANNLVAKVVQEIIPQNKTKYLGNLVLIRTEILDLLDARQAASSEVEALRTQARPYMNSFDFMISAVTGLRPALEATTVRADTEYQEAKARTRDLEYILTLLQSATDEDIKEAVDKTEILFKQDKSWMADFLHAIHKNFVRAVDLITEAHEKATADQARKLANVAAREKVARRWRRRLPNIPNLDVFLIPDADLTEAQREYKTVISRYFAKSPEDEAMTRKEVEAKLLAGVYTPMFSSPEAQAKIYGSRGYTKIIIKEASPDLDMAREMWVKDSEISTEKDDIRTAIRALKRATAIERGLALDEFAFSDLDRHIAELEERISEGLFVDDSDIALIKSRKLYKKLEVLGVSRMKIKNELTKEDIFGPAKTAGGRPVKVSISEKRQRELEANIRSIDNERPVLMAELKIWVARAEILGDLDAGADISPEKVDVVETSNVFCQLADELDDAKIALNEALSEQGDRTKKINASNLLATEKGDRIRAFAAYIDDLKSEISRLSQELETARFKAERSVDYLRGLEEVSGRTPNPYMFDPTKRVPGVQTYSPEKLKARTRVAGYPDDVLVPDFSLKGRIDTLANRLQEKEAAFFADERVIVLNNQIAKLESDAALVGLSTPKDPKYFTAVEKLNAIRDHEYKIPDIKSELSKAEAAAAQGTWLSDKKVGAYYEKIRSAVQRKLEKIEDLRGTKQILTLGPVAPVPVRPTHFTTPSTATLSELRRAVDLPKGLQKLVNALPQDLSAIDSLMPATKGSGDNVKLADPGVRIKLNPTAEAAAALVDALSLFEGVQLRTLMVLNNISDAETLAHMTQVFGVDFSKYAQILEKIPSYYEITAFPKKALAKFFEKVTVQEIQEIRSLCADLDSIPLGVTKISDKVKKTLGIGDELYPLGILVPQIPASLIYDNRGALIEITADTQLGGPRPLFSYEKNEQLDKDGEDEIRLEFAFLAKNRALTERDLIDDRLAQMLHPIFYISLKPAEQARIKGELMALPSDAADYAVPELNLDYVTNIAEIEYVVDLLERNAVPTTENHKKAQSEARQVLGFHKNSATSEVSFSRLYPIVQANKATLLDYGLSEDFAVAIRILGDAAEEMRRRDRKRVSGGKLPLGAAYRDPEELEYDEQLPPSYPISAYLARIGGAVHEKIEEKRMQKIYEQLVPRSERVLESAFSDNDAAREAYIESAEKRKAARLKELGFTGYKELASADYSNKENFKLLEEKLRYDKALIGDSYSREEQLKLLEKTLRGDWFAFTDKLIVENIVSFKQLKRASDNRLKEREKQDIREFKAQMAALCATPVKGDFAKFVAANPQTPLTINAYFFVYERYRGLGGRNVELSAVRDDMQYVSGLQEYASKGVRRLEGRSFDKFAARAGFTPVTDTYSDSDRRDELLKKLIELRNDKKVKEIDIEDRLRRAALDSVAFSGLTYDELKKLVEDVYTATPRAAKSLASAAGAQKEYKNRSERALALQDLLDRSSKSERIMLFAGDLLRKEYEELCKRAYEDAGIAYTLDKSATAQEREKLKQAKAISDDMVKHQILAGNLRRILPLDIPEDQRDIMTLPPGISPPRDTASASSAAMLSTIRDLAGFRNYAEYLVALQALQGESLARTAAEVYRRRAAINRKKAGRRTSAVDEGIEKAELALFDIRNDSPVLSDFAESVGLLTQLEANSGESRYKSAQSDRFFIDLTGSKRDAVLEKYNLRNVCDSVTKELKERGYACSAEEKANPVLALATAQRRGVISTTDAKYIAKDALTFALDQIIAKGAFPAFETPVSAATGRMLGYGQDEILGFLATAGISPSEIGLGNKDLTVLKSAQEIKNNLNRLRNEVLRIMERATAGYYERLADIGRYPELESISPEQRAVALEKLTDSMNEERTLACLAKPPGEAVAYILATMPDSLVDGTREQILSAVYDAVTNSLRGAESGKAYLEGFISKITTPGSGISRTDIVSRNALDAINNYALKSKGEIADILRDLEGNILKLADAAVARNEIKLEQSVIKDTPGATLLAILTERSGDGLKPRYHIEESGLFDAIISSAREAISDATAASTSGLSKFAEKPQPRLYDRIAATESEFLTCINDINGLTRELESLAGRQVTPGDIFPATAPQSRSGLSGDIASLEDQISSLKQIGRDLVAKLNTLYKEGNVKAPSPAVLLAISDLKASAAPRKQNPTASSRYRDRMSGRRNNPEEMLWHYEDTGPADLLSEGMSGVRSKRAMRRMNPETSPVISAFSSVFGMNIDTSACDTSHRLEVERARCLVRLQRDLTRDNVAHILVDLGGDPNGITGTFLKRVARQAAQAIKLELRERPHREHEITPRLQAAMRECLYC